MTRSTNFSLLSLLFLGSCAGSPLEVGELATDGTGTDGETSTSSGGESTSAATSSGGASGSGGSDTTGSGTGSTSAGATSSGGSTGGVVPDVGSGCACEPDQLCSDSGCVGGVVFLNFDGPTLVAGGDDATANEFGLATGSMQPYGGTQADRDALVDAVTAVFAEYSLHVTSTRPDAGPYAMLVLGDNVDGGGPLAWTDCGDANPNSVGVVGVYADDGLSDDVRAVLIAHTYGHGIGLEHVTTAHVMGTGPAGGLTFAPACVPTVASGICAPQHTAHCPAGEQNSHAELLDALGPA